MRSKNKNPNDIPMEVVYRSGMPHEVELVANTLDEAGIPYYRQEEIGTTRLAMPFQPSMGPGVYWIVIVPATEREKAAELISNLPISHDEHPDVWGFKPAPEAKKFFRYYAIFILVTSALGLLAFLLEQFK